MKKDPSQENHQHIKEHEEINFLEEDAFQKALRTEPPRPRHPIMILMYVCCLIGFLNSTTNGYDGSLMNALLINTQFRNFFGTENVGVEAGILTSMYQIGGVVALPFVGPAVDTWGRRIGMMIGSFMIIIGSTLTGTSSLNGSLAQFLAGRFFLGFGVSISTSAGPIYVIELAHPAFRGRLTGLYNVCWFSGSIIASICARFAADLPGNRSWDVPLYVQMIAPGIIFCTAMLLPESPRWLYVNNKRDRAKVIVTKFYGLGNPESIWVQLQLDEYENFLVLDGADKRWWDYRALFRDRRSVYRLCCNMCVSIFTQWAGNGIVSYYLSGMLDTAGVTGEMEQFDLNIGLSCAQFVFAIVGGLMSDTWGRRTMLMAPMFSFCVCWIGVVAATSTVAKQPNNKGAGVAAIVMVFLFDVIFATGITPLQALYPTEVLSFEMRAKGLAVSSLVTNAAMLLNQFAIPVALERIAWKLYIVYAVWCLVQGAVFYFLLPETRGFTLEELDKIFAEPNPVKGSLRRLRERRLCE